MNQRIRQFSFIQLGRIEEVVGFFFFIVMFLLCIAHCRLIPHVIPQIITVMARCAPTPPGALHQGRYVTAYIHHTFITVATGIYDHILKCKRRTATDRDWLSETGGGGGEGAELEI